MLELPVTRDFVGFLSDVAPSIYPFAMQPLARSLGLATLLARTSAIERITLTPEGMVLADMKALVRRLLSRGQRLFTFSFHSPSLSPGNTPYVRTQQDLGQFLAHLRGFLEFFMGELHGEAMTPFQARDRFTEEP
jgi:hypothetical protein